MRISTLAATTASVAVTATIGGLASRPSIQSNSAALTASSADLTRQAIAARGARGEPLTLYPMWCAFATALSTHIWLLNCGRG